MAKLILPSFAKGELSPALYGRVDTAAYQVGLKTARNCIVHPYGGISNRPGLRYIGPCKDHTAGNNVRLIPFKFKTTDAYILEFGNLYMRVIRNDAHVLNTAQTGCTATAANPIVVTKTSHPFSDGDEVYCSGFTEMTELNTRRFIVANSTANTFELTSQADGTNIDGTGYTAETTGGSVAEVYTLTTPYAEDDLLNLKFVQSADVMTLTHPDYATYELGRTDHNAWTLTEPDFVPTQDHPTGMSATADSGTGTTHRYQVTAIAVDTLEESLPALSTTTSTPESATAANPVVVTDTGHPFADGDEIEINGFVEMTELNGRRFTVASSTANTYELADENGTGYTAESTGGTAALTWDEVSGAANPDNTVSWTAVSGAQKYAVYRDDNGIMGLLGETEETTFKDDNLTADLEFSPPKYRNPFFGTNNKPATVSYYEQRRVFGGSNDDPDTAWYSQTGAYNNFTYSVPGQQDDSITTTLNALEVNEIRHFIPLNDLIVLTSGSEWRVNSGSDVAFAGDTLRQKPQSYWGSSHRRPIVIGSTILYVQENDSIVRSLGYSFQLDGYVSQDLSLLSNHIFDEYVISDWAYVRNPDSIIVAVRSDGEAGVLTFQQEQEVVAWTRWDTDGDFESVASIRPSGEVDDAAYFVVERKINGNVVKYIERTHSRRFQSVEDCFFVDSGLSLDVPITVTGATAANPVVITTSAAHGLANGDEVDIRDIMWEPDFDSLDNESQPSQLNGYRYTVANKTATTFELTDSDGNNIDGSAFNAYKEGGSVRLATTTVTGLDHLEGESVVALCNGNVVDSLTVSGGSITFNRKFSIIHVGLKFFTDIETLNIELPAGGTLQGRKVFVPYVTLRFYKSRGAFIGPDFENLKEMKQREFEVMGAPTALLTGDKRHHIPSTWQSNGRVAIRQRYPLPITLLAVVPELNAED